MQPIPKSLLGKRTEAQYMFDSAVHGWAFCNAAMLVGKLKTAEERYAAIGHYDEGRHNTVEAIRSALVKQNE